MIWSEQALGDLVRLHAFLADANPQVAARVVQTFTAAVARLPQNPRLGLHSREDR